MAWDDTPNYLESQSGGWSRVHFGFRDSQPALVPHPHPSGARGPDAINRVGDPARILGVLRPAQANNARLGQSCFPVVCSRSHSP